MKSSFCKVCDAWQSLSGTLEFETWKESHEDECQINHEGSAGKMEVDAVREMFERSEEKYNVRYASNVGDGDWKTYKSIIVCNLYKDITVIKK